MNISAVLLAGGESRRMGQDKATLVFRGKPLWEIQLDLLRKLRPTEIFLSAQSDPVWRPADVHFVPDHRPSRGPLSGLAATLSRIGTDHLLALAIDMPLMKEDFLRSLCHAIKPSVNYVSLACLRMKKLAFETLTGLAISCELVFGQLLSAHSENADEKAGEDGLKAESDKCRPWDDEPHGVGVIQMAEPRHPPLANCSQE
jgi:molybdopterin-guanine dinucleotide biosynthesis protein A